MRVFEMAPFVQGVEKAVHDVCLRDRDAESTRDEAIDYPTLVGAPGKLLGWIRALAPAPIGTVAPTRVGTARRRPA
jgi:hypothetical protein